MQTVVVGREYTFVVSPAWQSFLPLLRDREPVSVVWSPCGHFGLNP